MDAVCKAGACHQNVRVALVASWTGIWDMSVLEKSLQTAVPPDLMGTEGLAIVTTQFGYTCGDDLEVYDDWFAFFVNNPVETTRSVRTTCVAAHSSECCLHNHCVHRCVCFARVSIVEEYCRESEEEDTFTSFG